MKHEARTHCKEPVIMQTRGVQQSELKDYMLKWQYPSFKQQRAAEPTTYCQNPTPDTNEQVEQIIYLHGLNCSSSGLRRHSKPTPEGLTEEEPPYTMNTRDRLCALTLSIWVSFMLVCQITSVTVCVCLCNNMFVCRGVCVYESKDV